MTDAHLHGRNTLGGPPQGGEPLGAYALVVEGRLEECFPSNRDALRAGVERHGLGAFSVLRIDAAQDA